MTQWTERLKGHQIWQNLQNLGPVIDTALALEGTDPQATEGLVRLKAVLSFAGKRLAGADAYLIQPAPFDSLSNALLAATQEVQNFIANGNVGHITNANANADNVLANLAQINVQLTTEDFIAAKEAADLYRQGLDRALTETAKAEAQALEALAALKKQISDLSTEIAAQRTSLTTISTDYQNQFSAAQEARSREFVETQKDAQDRGNSLLTDYTQKLSEQNTGFTKQREDIERQHQGELSELKKQFVNGATELRDEIMARKVEVEKLVGVIGNLGVTSGYLTTANEAKTTVRVWQVVTVVAMFGLIAIAYVAFLPVVEGGFTWSGFAGRVFVSLTVGVLAAYAASQADRYQKLERQNRKLALELEAFGPFIAPLPKEKQEEFRLTIGDRSFGHSESVHSGLDGKSPATIIDMVIESKQFRALVTDIVKAAKS